VLYIFQTSDISDHVLLFNVVFVEFSKGGFPGTFKYSFMKEIIYDNFCYSLCISIQGIWPWLLWRSLCWCIRGNHHMTVTLVYPSWFNQGHSCAYRDGPHDSCS